MLRTSLIIATMLMFLQSVSLGKQHPVVKAILQNKKSCGENYFFSQAEIESSQSQKFFRHKLKDLAPGNKSSSISNLTEDFVVLPVDRCVLRGNRNFRKNEKVLISNFKVKTIVNPDFLVHRAVNKQKKSQIENYIYTPMSPTQYPHTEGRHSFTEALKHLSTSSPRERAMVLCFFGKHRTGMIIGAYQFLGEYAASAQKACQNVGTLKDKAYLQMNLLGDSGLFTYNLPSAFREFYVDFANSVCQDNSFEFLNGQLEADTQ